jgi:hypothetical protein
MSRTYFPAAAVLIGFVLLVGSWIWPSLVGGRHAWSDSDAAQYQQAAAQFHDLTYKYGAALQQAEQSDKSSLTPVQETADSRNVSGPYTEVKNLADQLAQVKERYEGLSAKLNSAQNGGLAAANVMRWVGIGAIVIGAVGFYAERASGVNR